MTYIIFAILLPVAFIGFLIWLSYSNEEKKGQFRLGAFGILIVVEVLMYLLNSPTMTSTNNLLLESTFGKMTNVYSDGLNWPKPWADTREINGLTEFSTQEVLTVPICDSALGSVN